MTQRLLIKNASQIVTPKGHSAVRGADMKDVAIYENQSILIEDGTIVAIGDNPAWEKEIPTER